ncbi:Uncharacterized protein PECH_004678 [Penicillium ucsense]|uniref:Uncharacterized protein n=1 Tax=Penicillium ucsense TaxID=2839758 RepID=A0A8J8WKK4_9EURO|nr:Uncharacterized protein PECM_003435 [Penicillium ucsense]KAF7736873.1 Uncharacterized protein PECH_004678 [Penicillium ucsense]
MGNKSSAISGLAHQPRQGDYALVLDAEKKLHTFPGPKDGDQESPEKALSLQVVKWREPFPVLVLAVSSSSLKRDFKEDMDETADALQYTFKLPANYPGGRAALLNTIRELIDGSKPHGITETYTGKKMTNKFLFDKRANRLGEKNFKWQDTKVQYGCHVDWAQYSSKIFFRLRAKSREMGIIVVDRHADGYKFAVGQERGLIQQIRFAQLIALPARIWLHVQYQRRKAEWQGSQASKAQASNCKDVDMSVSKEGDRPVAEEKNSLTQEEEQHTSQPSLQSQMSTADKGLVVDNKDQDTKATGKRKRNRKGKSRKSEQETSGKSIEELQESILPHDTEGSQTERVSSDQRLGMLAPASMSSIETDRGDASNDVQPLRRGSGLPDSAVSPSPPYSPSHVDVITVADDCAERQTESLAEKVQASVLQDFEAGHFLTSATPPEHSSEAEAMASDGTSDRSQKSEASQPVTLDTPDNPDRMPEGHLRQVKPQAVAEVPESSSAKKISERSTQQGELQQRAAKEIVKFLNPLAEPWTAPQHTLAPECVATVVRRECSQDVSNQQSHQAKETTSPSPRATGSSLADQSRIPEFTMKEPCVALSMPPDLLREPPTIPCMHGRDRPERHRQALWFSTARDEGDYFIFADGEPDVDVGWEPAALRGRCSLRLTHVVRFDDPGERDRFRRVLAVCLLESLEVQSLVGYLFRMLRDRLRSEQQWSPELDVKIRRQLTWELAICPDAREVGQRHACDAEWLGLPPRTCRERTCAAERPSLLGRPNWSRWFERIVSNEEASHWILRANRTTHPVVKGVQARIRGEGFDHVPDDERRLFRRGEGWDGLGSGPWEWEGDGELMSTPM